MSDYYPVIEDVVPTREVNTLVSPELISQTYQKMRIIREKIRRTIALNEQIFRIIDIQTDLSEVKNTDLNQFLVNAVTWMEEYAPRDLVDQALPYIYELNDLTKGYDNLDLPPLSVSLPENEELLVEWNFEHISIGLSFEINPEESGWYIVHDGTVNKMTAWAYLTSQTITELVETILSQVLEYAS